ncbi:MAG: bifunctional (p)ppGpp synthetase/guanosine-3',5'-bis(diphosphate) 3'-pyrophosphohydrolase [Clostridia bacterium]|nr:bifunctional (p)ppGpp synthetase/guanosine-3',5'-bis(diphosphate) 3'-pyrophosphohydrolase [Clostridia bacterium]
MKEDFLKYIREHYELYDGRLIEQAYKLAIIGHKNDKRLSGDDWIEHSAGVAMILAEMHMDAETVAAGLLHDVLDHTDLTAKDISEATNDNVDELVKGITKVNGLKYGKNELDETENLRRLIVAMGKDIRVIIIKLADRLHNMRTIEFLPREKQIKYSTETSEVFAPLAERLGLSAMHAELNNLCFKTLNPEDYKELEEELNSKYDKWQQTMKRIKGVLNYTLKEYEIDGKVSSRFKSLYSMYKKFQKKGTEKIYDIIAFRILVNNVDDCYRVLGAAHQKFRLIPGRIKDYIAAPKPNGYQSLHTTLLTDDGTPFELQIRTFEMHEYCEYGIAAHWNYKGASDNAFMLQEKLDWIKNLIEQDMQITDNKNFVKALQVDFSSSEIWVFTPKHKPINLPEGATPIDFAYAVHSELGDKCIGCKVNGKQASVATKLETGDVVEIITSVTSKGPSRDWLNVVVSRDARKNIMQFFKKNMTEENITLGKNILEYECQKAKISLGEILSDENFAELKEKYNFVSIDDMFAAVGYKGVTVNQIMKPILTKIQEKQISKQALENSPFIIEGKPIERYKLSHCCSPIPGDEIMATVNKEGLYSIHTTDCKNLRYIGGSNLKAEWNPKVKRLYDVHLSFVGEDCVGALNKLLSVVHRMDLTFSAVKAQALPNNKFEIMIALRVFNKRELDRIILNIRQSLPFVKAIARKNIG